MATRERTEDGTSPSAHEKVSFWLILSDPAVRVVMLVVFVVMIGFGIIAPILPLFAQSFGVSYDAVGLLISAFAFTRLFFDLVAGPIVDRYGERLAASFGLVFVGVSSVLTGLAPNFTLAVILRGAGGAGSSILFAALYSYLLKVIPKHRMARTLGLFYGTFNVGLIAGTPLGGLIAHRFGLASPLYFYAALCFAAALLYWRLVPDPRAVAEPTPPTEQEIHEEGLSLPSRTRMRVKGLLRNRAFVTVIVTNFAYFWMVAAVYDTLIPLFAKDSLRMSTVGIGIAFAVAMVGELLVLYHAGSAADKRGRKAVLAPSLVGLMIAIAIIGWTGSPLVFMVALAFLGIASGYAGVPPGAMLSDVVPERASGTAVGVYRFFGDLGFVLGPLLAGVTTNALGFKPAFVIATAPVLLALALVARTPETLKPSQREPVLHA